ncbi:MAG: hypothetical protein DME86_04685 [Verrucomicrobia bacterium]|nr:MAG: hypothetical protein DME86_04685 [Verrucomicrobiota bacterium]
MHGLRRANLARFARVYQESATPPETPPRLAGNTSIDMPLHCVHCANEPEKMRNLASYFQKSDF